MWDEEYADLDPAFAERDRIRKKGLPVQIARTRRLVIREIVAEDVPYLFEIFQQPGIKDMMRPPRTLEEEREFMRAYISHAYAFYDYGLWCVLEKESGKIVGEAGLFPSERVKDAVEMGYIIAPDFQRRGYAAECGEAGLAYAFHTLDLEEIHLFTDRENQALLRTAKRLGFQVLEEGVGDSGLLHLRALPAPPT